MSTRRLIMPGKGLRLKPITSRALHLLPKIYGIEAETNPFFWLHSHAFLLAEQMLVKQN